MSKKRTYNKSSLNKDYNQPTSNTLLDRMRRNPLLTWLSDMVSLSATDTIKVPQAYRDKVIQTKLSLNNDVSGLVNTILDFSIDVALVEFTAETKNKNLTNMLNKWLKNINVEMRGKIPVGIKALAKEYYRERWKGSSFLLLRTFWEKKDGYILPTTLYFLDGEDIVVNNPKDTVNLDGKTYYLRLGDDPSKWKKLPNQKNEQIFIQKPYSSWGVDYSVPYLIQRGVWKNLKFLLALEEKGETVVRKALEYIAMLKKGSENLALSGNPNLSYSDEELKKTASSFKDMMSKRKHMAGMSTYVTHFDTELEHIIPDYARALKQELYTPIERRMLAGLGLVEVVQGITTTRRESTLNPKPFFAEVNTAIDDFKALLLDIMMTIVKENKFGHRKYFGQDIKIRNSKVREELTKDILTQIRSGYDRGSISKRSYLEALGYDLDTEIERRKDEKATEKITYPPVIQNQEQFAKTPDHSPKPKPDGKTPSDKKGIETKNYLKALEEAICYHCGEEFDFESQDEIQVGVVECPNCEGSVDKRLILEEVSKIYEQAPYTNKNYPATIKNLPVGARSIWINTFNSVFKDTHSETNARMAAWRNVKLKYKKQGDKWVPKSKGEIEESIIEYDDN